MRRTGGHERGRGQCFGIDFASLSQQQKAEIENDLQDAYDFDPRDPLYGLSKAQLSGPRLERRTVLRLMAAAGTLTAMHLVPGLAPRRALAQERGGTLQGGWSGVSEIRTLDPARIDQVEQFQITSNVLSGLTHIDGEFVAQPDLAEDWSVSDDGTEYTFHLREGVTFHNGDPFTADDVVFTYNRSKDPAKSIHSQVLVNVAGRRGGRPADRALQARPAAGLVPGQDHRARERPRADHRQPPRARRARRGAVRPDAGRHRPVPRRRAHAWASRWCWRRSRTTTIPARPKLERVIVQPIVEAEPLAAALEAGDIQIIGGAPVPAELIERFQSNPDIVVDMAPRPGFYAIYMNPWREPMQVADFNKPLEELLQEPGFQVRAALARALDRDRYIEIGNLGFGEPSFGSVNPALVAMYDPAIAEKSQQRYQPDSARELLAAAGYPGRRGHPAAGADAQPRRPPPRPGAGRHHAPRDRRRDPARPGRQHRARRAPRPPRFRPPGAEQRRRLRSRRRPGRLHDHRTRSSTPTRATRRNTRSAISPRPRSTAWSPSRA